LPWPSPVKIDRSVNPALATSLGRGAAIARSSHDHGEGGILGTFFRSTFDIGNRWKQSDNAFQPLRHSVLSKMRAKCCGFRDEMAREARRL